MFVIKSVSEEGIFYLCKNWNRQKMIWRKWVVLEKDVYKTEKGALCALTKLLKIMDEYKSDIFYLCEIDPKTYEIREKYQISVN